MAVEVEKKLEGEPRNPEKSGKESKKKPRVEKFGRLAVDKDPSHDHTRIALLNKDGQKVGMADYEMFITPDMESKVKVQIHDADVEKAGELVDNVDDPETVKEMLDQMTEDRLNAVLTIAFRKFYDAGGSVFEATKLTFGQDGVTSVHPGRNLESNENKLTKNYIIPMDGEDKLRDIFSGNVHVSFDDVGSRFKITRRDMPDALGDKGFTLIWESKGSSGNPITFELNFFYGMEESKMQPPDTQFGVEDVDFGGMNMAEEEKSEDDSKKEETV